MDNEIWKDILGYEGLYQISNKGRVKSFQGGKVKILKGCLTADGYPQVTLSKNGEQKRKIVGRLVAEMFIPNPDNKPYIDHINTIRDDNRVCNLRWVTHTENMNNELTLQHLKERVCTEETRRKMSEVRKGMLAGEKNPMYGKQHSEEVRKKLSEKMKGKNIGKGGKKVRCINTDEVFISIGEASRKLNRDASDITRCCKGKKKDVKGYRFEYYKEE